MTKLVKLWFERLVYYHQMNSCLPWLSCGKSFKSCPMTGVVDLTHPTFVSYARIYVTMKRQCQAGYKKPITHLGAAFRSGHFKHTLSICMLFMTNERPLFDTAISEEEHIASGCRTCHLLKVTGKEIESNVCPEVARCNVVISYIWFIV